MGVDLSKVISASTYNSYKNDGFVYTGSFTTPITLTAAQQYTATQSVTLATQPQFSKFFANFQEFADLFEQYHGNTDFNPAEWYPCNVGGYENVGLTVTAPMAQQGPIQASIYPVILAGTLLSMLYINNPYNVTITLTSISIPWAFVVYSLAN